MTKIFPPFTEFKDSFLNKENQIVYSKVSTDLDTPVSLMLKLNEASKNSFILESVTGGEIRGRYSVIGMRPDLIWECNGNKSKTNKTADQDLNNFKLDEKDCLDSLRSIVSQSKITLPEDIPPMAAGLFGYLGYDMIRHVEKLAEPNPDTIGVPDSIMIRPSLVVVIDNIKNEVILITPVWHNKFQKSENVAKKAYEQATTLLKVLKSKILRPTTLKNGSYKSTLQIRNIKSNFSKKEYFALIEKAKRYIISGDIFQVVLSQRWKLPFTLSPFSFYRALRKTNPSPYMFYFNFGTFQIVGASPEILVKVSNGEITIRPIAGTRPRGRNKNQDQELELELKNDPKELAEHLMLLDLGRNDVGKVSITGSVRPTEQFIVERYSHVMHIVSNVQGILKKSSDSLSALLAGLPAGTVSGAPKIRAMEIIDELETEKRGVYGGGVGYFGVNGDMDMCIALRTAVLKDDFLYIQAGGGVVYDSNPQLEYEETINKAEALKQAAEDASVFQ